MTMAVGPIPPDTKDWTWVLERPCPECGYDASTVAAADLPHEIRANASVWLALMGDPDVTVRPEPERVVAAGVRLPRPRRAPGLPRADDRDADRGRAAVRQLGPGHHGRRAALRPAGARDRRADAGGRRRTPWATSTPRSRASDWDRKGIRSDGSVFTIASLGRYHLHDVVHHLHDVATLAERVTVGVLRRVRRRLRRRHQRHARRGRRQHRRFVGRARHRGAGAGDRLGPRARRRWRWSRSGINVRRTDITPGVRRAAALGRLPADVVDPLARRPHRPAARRRAVRRGVGQRLAAARARDSLPVVLRRLAAVTRAGRHCCT